MEVQGLVMRSVQVGRDASYLTDELTKRYGITQRRAELISRDQNNKATSVMNRARQLEIGITEAKWRHSHAGQHPRISHLEADGKVYSIAEGCKIDGEFIWPGEKINCRCTAKPILPGWPT
jgi:SPP1 gp7 family putative phage head morphogenesis protein